MHLLAATEAVTSTQTTKSCGPTSNVFNLGMRQNLLLLQKCVDKGKEINLTGAVSKDTITRGLRYAVATGNWGQQGTADLRAGVSQVRKPRSLVACSTG